MPNDRLGTSYTDADALRDVFGGSSSGGSTGVYSDIDALRDVFGPQYVAGGPGGIPGAKDGSIEDAPIDLDTVRAIMAFKQQVKAQGGDIDGKSHAEILRMMGRNSLAGGQAGASILPMGKPTENDIASMRYEAGQIAAEHAADVWVKYQKGALTKEQADAEIAGITGRNQSFQAGVNSFPAGYQEPVTALDEFSRGLRRGVSYGLPAGLDFVREMRTNEQVRRAPEGVAGFAGQTLGGFSGLLDPGKAPENFGAIVFTGGVGRLAAGTLDVIGKNVAESLGKEAGARAVNMIREAIENAGQGGGMAALNELGNIPIDEWKRDPMGSLARVAKAGGVGALAAGGLGAAFGAARSGEVPRVGATLPERVAPDTFRLGQEAGAGMAPYQVQEGNAALNDVNAAYRNAPRANEIDPAVLAARNAADAQALAQAAESAKIIENAPEPARVETPETQIGANREEAQGQAQGNQEGLLSKEPPSPDTPAAVDWSTKSYAEIRARAKELGVLDGPKTRAALVERVSAAETRSAQGTPTPESPESASARMGNGAAPAKETPSVATSQPSRPATADVGSGSSVQRSASPNPTRQPWEMTRDEYLSSKPVITKPERTLTLNEWRARNGYQQPLDEHGGLRYPHGISKAERSRIKARLDKAQREYAESEAKYSDLLGRGEIPKVQETVDLGSGVASDLESSWALARSTHKRAVTRALSEGRAVPPEVLKDYPDLAAPAKPPTPDEPATTAAGTGAAQAESPRASGESTALEFGNNPNSDKNQYELRRDDRGPYSRSLTGWVLLNKKVKSGEGFTTVRTDIPESALEIAYDTPHTMTDTGYTMKENKILSLMKKTEGQRQDILRRVLAARTSKDKTPVWSDSDGNIQTGEGSYRNRGTKLWEPLNEAARAAKVRIDRQKSASPGRVDTPKDVRGRDIYVYARSNSGQVKPMAGPFYTQHEAEAATREIRNRIDKGFSRVSVIRDFAGFSYGAVDRGSPVDVLYPDIRSPEGSSPFTDYPGTGQGTAPKEGTAGTAAIPPPQEPRATEPQPPEVRAKAETEQTANRLPPEGVKAPEPAKESPVPDSQQDASGSSSPDFTARRVVDQPEPGEPEGFYTSAKNAVTEEKRTKLGLKAYDGPERRSWGAAMDTAVAKGIPERSLDIASSVIAKPRQLSDIEQAGMVRRLMDLEIKDRDIRAKIAQTTDNAELLALAAEGERNLAEFDTITTGINKGGTEIGRALAIRKMMLAEDYSIMAVKTKARANAAKAGHTLTPEQLKEFETLAGQFESMAKRMEEAVGKLEAERAEATLKRHAASKRGVDPKVREQNIATLAEKARTLLSQGCR